MAVTASQEEIRSTVPDDENWHAALLHSLAAVGAQRVPQSPLTGIILPLVVMIVVIWFGSLGKVILDFEARRSGNGIVIFLALVLPIVLLLLVFRILFRLLRRTWQFRAPSAEEEFARDSATRPIFYLRAFALDAAMTKASLPQILFGTAPVRSAEQNIAAVLRRHGPLIAIGHPQEKLPALGAARFYVGDAHWKQAVADIAGVSQLVVWATGTTEGLRWEISHLLANVPLRKLIVWAHPHLLNIAEHQREAEWSRFRNTLGSVFPKPFPVALGDTRFFWFKDDGTPVAGAPRRSPFALLVRSVATFQYKITQQVDALKGVLAAKQVPLRPTRSFGQWLADPRGIGFLLLMSGYLQILTSPFFSIESTMDLQTRGEWQGALLSFGEYWAAGVAQMILGAGMLTRPPLARAAALVLTVFGMLVLGSIFGVLSINSFGRWRYMDYVIDYRSLLLIPALAGFLVAAGYYLFSPALRGTRPSPLPMPPRLQPPPALARIIGLVLLAFGIGGAILRTPLPQPDLPFAFAVGWFTYTVAPRALLVVAGIGLLLRWPSAWHLALVSGFIALVSDLDALIFIAGTGFGPYVVPELIVLPLMLLAGHYAARRSFAGALRKA